jgi:hypothetical protein
LVVEADDDEKEVVATDENVDIHPMAEKVGKVLDTEAENTRALVRKAPLVEHHMVAPRRAS